MLRAITIQIIACVLLTVIGVAIAVVNNLGNPPVQGQRFALIVMAVIYALWVLQAVERNLRRSERQKAIGTTIIFGLAYVMYSLVLMVPQKFNSDTWRSSIDHHRSYAGYPAHRSGGMVADIINSRKLIGLSKDSVQELLGINYFMMPEYHGDSVIFFFYSGRQLLDNCDMLAVNFTDGRCSGAGYYDCD